MEIGTNMYNLSIISTGAERGYCGESSLDTYPINLARLLYILEINFTPQSLAIKILLVSMPI